MPEPSESNQGEVGLLFRRDLVPEYEDYCAHELRLAPTTVRNYTSGLRHLERFFDKPAHKLTAQDLMYYRRAPLKSGTVALHIKAGKYFHDWGATKGYWHRNGIAAVKVPNQDSDEYPPIAYHDAKRALLACRSPIEFQVVYYPLYEGCRIYEAIMMRPDNWQGEWLDFVGKRGKRRRVPIHPALREVRDILFERFTTSRTTAERNFAKLRNRIDLRGITGEPAVNHGLRKCFAETTYDEGRVNWEVVQTLLGHSLGVSETYFHVTEQQKLDAVLPLDYFKGDPVQLELFG